MHTSLGAPGFAVLFNVAADYDAEVWLVLDDTADNTANARLAMRRPESEPDWMTEWFGLPTDNILPLSHRREEHHRQYNLTHASEEELTLLFAGVTVRYRLDTPPVIG